MQAHHARLTRWVREGVSIHTSDDFAIFARFLFNLKKKDHLFGMSAPAPSTFLSSKTLSYESTTLPKNQGIEPPPYPSAPEPTLPKKKVLVRGVAYSCEVGLPPVVFLQWRAFSFGSCQG
jgi:hypothetical protein